MGQKILIMFKGKLLAFRPESPGPKGKKRHDAQRQQKKNRQE
jgi:hypothetical protein